MLRISEDLLKEVFRLVAMHTKKRFFEGRISQWLSTEGHLALMSDKITRYYSTKKYEELLDLCVDSIVALGSIPLPIKSNNFDTGEIEEELKEEIAEEPPEKQINPNAFEESGQSLDNRWRPDGDGVRLDIR